MHTGLDRCFHVEKRVNDKIHEVQIERAVVQLIDDAKEDAQSGKGLRHRRGVRVDCDVYYQISRYVRL